MCPKDADRLANGEDPVQTAPRGEVWSGSAQFDLVCPKTWIIVVFADDLSFYKNILVYTCCGYTLESSRSTHNRCLYEKLTKLSFT